MTFIWAKQLENSVTERLQKGLQQENVRYSFLPVLPALHERRGDAGPITTAVHLTCTEREAEACWLHEGGSPAWNHWPDALGHCTASFILVHVLLAKITYKTLADSLRRVFILEAAPSGHRSTDTSWPQQMSKRRQMYQNL